MPVQSKICGITAPEALDAAVKGGASHIGFMFYPPSPRHAGFDCAAELAVRVPEHVRRVGVFVEPCNALLEQAVEVGKLDIIQLHKTPPNRARAIADQFKLEVWAAVAIKTRADLAQLASYRDAVQRILYDASSGTGTRLDWTMLAGVDHPMPWALAGGLDPYNVTEAIRVTGAPLVDVSSGVESAPGVKDVDKIAAFLKAAAL